VRQLKDLGYQQKISATLATTVEGAKKRGVPVARLSPEYSGYLYLGQGSRQRRIRWSEPDAVSGVARLASTDKYLTNQLLASIGVPVPLGRLVSRVEEAWTAANEVGLPVAVKPYNCDLQTGVSLDLRTRERVEIAFQAAIEHSSWVLVEHFAPGVEHRVLVVGQRVVAVTRIEPPHVIGDGVLTVAQLVEKVNQEPRRSGDDRSAAPLSKLKLDEVALFVLASQGYSLDSVPPLGTMVLVRRDPPYFKNGGTLTDLTNQIHSTTAAHAVAASQMMQIPVAGLDVVAVDISRPLEEQGGVIVEINSNPGFWLHLAPWADTPRPVGEEVTNWLFPTGDGRIPIIALVGDIAKFVGPSLTESLARQGLRVGSAGPDVMSVNGRRWPAPAGKPQDRAHALFRIPVIDIALFETDADELLEHGFASDRCDVAVLSAPVPSAQPNEVEFVKALSNALGATGTVVAASDWRPVPLAVSSSQVILVFSPNETETRTAHVNSGGRAVFRRGRDVIMVDGKQAEFTLGEVPEDLPAAEERHVLYTLAAAWSVGQRVTPTGDG
jgi:cyanophycin synthetase